jgi:hypothetical protein
MKKKWFLVPLCVLLLLSAGNADAEKWHNSNKLLNYAVPDECYAGLGGIDYPGGITPGDGFTTPVNCPATIPNPNYDGTNKPDLTVYKKTNDTYVWALTEEGNSLWFAAAANVMCTTAGVFMDTLVYGEFLLTLERWTTTDPVTGATINNRRREPYSVCELGDSMIARSPDYPYFDEVVGDWRPSKLFRRILTGFSAGRLVELTPQIYAAAGDDGRVFDNLAGIRAAGSHNGVVFFAGASRQNNSIVMFAFRASTGRYLGYKEFTGLRQIRKMIVVKDQLYTGVASSTGVGQILRWRGSLTNLWNWEVVGRVLGSVAELSDYVDGNGRSRIVANASGGLYVSPPIYLAGLAAAQAGNWKRVWQPAVYEPDTTTIPTYGPGGVARLGEWVYWGTQHIPYHAFYRASEVIYKGLENVPDQTALYYGTFRTSSIWRARNLEGATPVIELLYGESQLPAYDGAAYTLRSTGWTPVSGTSGFGNPLNNYSWVALSFKDGTGEHLFFGTMDQSLATGGDVSDLYNSHFEITDNDRRGADLWRFSLNGMGTATATKAEAEFTNGAGNILNYGVRCLIASDDGTKIYVGTANSANLRHPEVEPYLNGGWELRELSR